MSPQSSSTNVEPVTLCCVLFVAKIHYFTLYAIAWSAVGMTVLEKATKLLCGCNRLFTYK